MVERAYSLEFGRELDAKKANQYSISGSLKSDKAFRCVDDDCQIPLTCTNWREKNGKRYYFRPSHNDEPHIEGCICITPQEVREQVKKEVSEAKKTTSKSGIISVKKSPNKAKVSSSNKHEEIDSTRNKNQNIKISHSRNDIQDRQLSSLATFVELFNDSEVDNYSTQIKIDGEVISLSDYFVDVTNDSLVINKNRVYFGLANISRAEFGENMLQIEFLNSSYPNIYSNIRQVQERANTKSIANSIDKDATTIYFRGLLNGKNNKFESFNDKFYKDLYSPDN